MAKKGQTKSSRKSLRTRRGSRLAALGWLALALGLGVGVISVLDRHPNAASWFAVCGLTTGAGIAFLVHRFICGSAQRERPRKSFLPSLTVTEAVPLVTAILVAVAAVIGAIHDLKAGPSATAVPAGTVLPCQETQAKPPFVVPSSGRT